jgi:hypothetical protein
MPYQRAKGMQTRSVAPRQRCPACGKKGLGNVYHGARIGAYRQCRYCDEIVPARLVKP